MSFGKRLIQARKKKGYSQEEVATQLGTKAPVIGRYERDEAKPSIEAAAKLANFLDVSLDYLAGKTTEQLDQKTMTRILEIQKMDTQEQNKIFEYIDLIIRDAKAKQAYS